jgi:hypothetical protein
LDNPFQEVGYQIGGVFLQDFFPDRGRLLKNIAITVDDFFNEYRLHQISLVGKNRIGIHHLQQGNTRRPQGNGKILA